MTRKAINLLQYMKTTNIVILDSCLQIIFDSIYTKLLAIIFCNKREILSISQLEPWNLKGTP